MVSKKTGFDDRRRLWPNTHNLAVSFIALSSASTKIMPHEKRRSMPSENKSTQPDAEFIAIDPRVWEAGRTQKLSVEAQLRPNAGETKHQSMTTNKCHNCGEICQVL